MAKAMKDHKGLKNSRFDVILLNRNHLNLLFDDKGDYYGVMKQRMKQVLPTTIAEIRTNKDTDCHEIYESSAMQPFEFNNGTIKKVDKYMSKHKQDFRSGYDFFKRLCEATTKNLILPELPDVNNGEMMTKTEILQTVMPAMEVLVEVPEAELEDENDSERSSERSDESDSEDDVLDLDVDSDEEICHIVCEKCGKIVQSKYHLERHTNSNGCRHGSLNLSVEARAVRLLRLTLDRNEIVMRDRDDDLSHLAMQTDKTWSDASFTKGWAKRQAHGKTKGHTYLTEFHKAIIKKFFLAGEEDKGKKKSAALMEEAMYFELENDENEHPHLKHYIPFISEIAVVISQCTTKQKTKVISTSSCND